MRYYLILVLIAAIPKLLLADSILVLGDSLSAAYGFDLEKGWVHLMQQKLDELDDASWQVINASVAGETTAGGLARLPELLDKYKPDLTILALGANDGLRGQSLEQFRYNLGAMIEQSSEAGRVLLLGMKLPPNYGKSYTNAFEYSYTAVAAEFEIEYVPFFIDGVTEKIHYMQADNFHPNAEAQEIILDNIWPAIQSIIDSSSMQ